MRRILKQVGLCGFSVFLSLCVHAGEVRVQASSELGMALSDNVASTASDKQTSLVTTIAAGGTLSFEGSKSKLNASYRGVQAFYSHDSSENQFFHQLTLSGTRSSERSGWSSSLTGSIRNSPLSTRRNASEDLLIGDLTETRTLGGELSYDNHHRGPLGVKFSVAVGVLDAGNAVGNSNDFGSKLTLNNGRLVKDYFWSLNLASSIKQSGRTSRENTSETFDYQLGTRAIGRLSPYIYAYAEKFSQRGGVGRDLEQDLATIGPGFRYHLSRQSYFELGYGKVLKGPQDNNVSAKLLWRPSRRTELQFKYGVRYYGESYDFRLRHQNNRWTNTISYSEGPDSFAREYLIDDENIEDLTLTRTLNWLSTFSFRRGSFSFSLEGRRRELGRLDATSDQGSNDTWGGSIRYRHKLSSNISLDTSVSYKQYSFEGDTSQTDDYVVLRGTLQHKLANSLAIDYGVSLTNRESSVEDFTYEESRLFANLKYDF